MNELEYNLKNIQRRIKEAAERVGRNPDEITLVAVTKTVEPVIINKAIELGVNHIGENRVQELSSKYNLIQANEVNWHLIGHLQRNKVKYIIDKVNLIHSVDSLKLAEEINQRAKKNNKIMEVLVQVNVAREESKFGIFVEECVDFINKLSQLPYIKVKGLMTIAPHSPDPENVRPIFKELKKLSIDIKRKNYDNIDMDYLSMGMSGDFEVAIEEGSNIVRIGTGIFGHRQY